MSAERRCNQLKILYASYGPPEAEMKRPWLMRIVTNKLREIAETSKDTDAILMSRWNGLFGDPCPEEKKILRVHYSINGQHQCGTWEEDSMVFLNQSRLRRASMDQGMNDSGQSGFRYINPDLLNAILAYLPVFPDQIACAQVSKSWFNSYKSNYSLVSTFKIGAHGIPGPVYIDKSVSFVKMVLSKSYASLVNLNLDNYKKLDDDMLSEISRSAQKLKILCLNCCSRITDTSLVLISENNKSLQQLEIKGLVKVTDKSIVPIAQNCTQIERLNISNCSKVTDLSVQAICDNLDKLVILHMKHCHKATDKSVRHLGAKQSKTLELLSLWSMHLLTDKCLSGFEGRTFLKLSSINFTGCYGFTDAGIRIISDNCKELLAINLGFCHRLQDSAVIYLAENLRKLEHLNLHYLYKLTDVSLEAIRKNLLCLRSLNISRCINLSVDALVSLSQELPNLTELFLKDCPKFSNDTVERIARVFVSRNGRLDLLDMRDNAMVTDEALEILTSSFGMQYHSFEKLFLMTSASLRRQSLAEFE